MCIRDSVGEGGACDRGRFYAGDREYYANEDGVWELLYPFAPQIQVTGDGAYLFHSGYASLVSSEASVVIGSQEGESDYYYDRMLLRDDDNFLSDLISLVEREAQGRK